MKILTKEDCPHCKKSFESSHDMDNIEPAINKGQIKEVQSTTNQVLETVEPKIIEKEVIKAVSPADEPFYTCKNGNCDVGMHKNPNYSKKPNKKCKNCDSLNGSKKCKNCGNSDKEEFEDIDDEDLESLGIPMPVEQEHNHDHED